MDAWAKRKTLAQNLWDQGLWSPACFVAGSEVPKVRVELTRGCPHRLLSLVPYVRIRFYGPVVLVIRA